MLRSGGALPLGTPPKIFKTIAGQDMIDEALHWHPCTSKDRRPIHDFRIDTNNWSMFIL